MKVFHKSNLSCLAASMLAIPAMADNLEECRAIPTDLDRLACYDMISGRTPASETLNDSSIWTTRIEQSEMTDETNVFLSVQSENEVSCRFGGSHYPRLLIRCREDTTALFLQTQCHLASGHGGYGRITFRIDNMESQEREFTASTNNRSLGLWRGNQSIPLIRQLLDAETLLMRFVPYGESAHTVRFPLTGLSEAIVPLREACNW